VAALAPTQLLERLDALADLVDAGEAGPAALERAVQLASLATGAAGAAFVEYGRAGGRLVLATEELTWVLGRPVDIAHPAVAAILAGPRLQELPVTSLTGELAGELKVRGLHRVVRVAACAGGTLVGTLLVFFADPHAALDGHGRAALSFLAGWCASLYRHETGLPVRDGGPVLGPRTDGMAVVGPDGVVRSWNPAAARITARPVEQAVGRPLPFPVPGPEQVLDHRMACGNWIRLRSTVLHGSDATLVTFRERPDEPREQDRDLFVAVTSHELRTPVTVIRGYADTLADHWDSLDEPARREAAAVVQQRARELSRLVDRLLTAASDAAGLIGATAGVPFDLVEALHAAAAELGAEQRARTRLAMPAALPKALGHRAVLATVLTELVTNACKYSPDRVDVELTAGADAQTVWFRVADRGVGVRPEHVERAFERFWQLETGDQRRYGGVGLGLYLVRRIIERQRGWVSLRPREGGGTVVEVRLPRADASPGEV
jgi:signal transduction histidine kinase